MFKATCSNCGKECEVPFKPTGSKPVYCRDCFRTMGGPDSRRTDGRGSAQPQYREQFEVLNVKLDKILKLLNPEKSMGVSKVVAEPQVEDTTNSVENVEPVKKKTRAKKLAPTKTDIPTETPTE